jgi:beta-lactamase class A
MLGVAAGALYLALHKPAVPAKKTQPTATPAPINPKAEEKSKPPLVNLQPVVDAWVAKQGGDYGIVVYDPGNEKIIGSYQPDKQFFTASIYKLYVVYLQLVDIQAGKREAGEQFRAGNTRQKCIEEAVRTSDSPCAEALMAELGNADINQRLAGFGLTNTSFPSFVTSAGDVAKVLVRFQAKRDLNDQQTALLRGVMEQQIYRKGLPAGMPQAVVADKVGFSETPHYHDVGIIKLPSGREYVVSFLSQGVGTRVVADFGTTVYAALNQ